MMSEIKNNESGAFKYYEVHYEEMSSTTALDFHRISNLMIKETDPFRIQQVPYVDSGFLICINWPIYKLFMVFCVRY